MDFEKPADVMNAERDLISRLDRIHKRNHPNELQLDARIASYQLAARLQVEASDALDMPRKVWRPERCTASLRIRPTHTGGSA